MAFAVVVAARALRDALGTLDPALLSGDDCAEIARELAATEKACSLARARTALRAADCGSHRRDGYARASDWLAQLSGVAPREARRDLEVAASLDRCPETEAALADGALSMAQAD